MQAKKPKNGVKIKPKSKEHYVNSKDFNLSTLLSLT